MESVSPEGPSGQLFGDYVGQPNETAPVTSRFAASPRLTADRAMMQKFVDGVFRRCVGVEGAIAPRGFEHGDKERSLTFDWIQLDQNPVAASVKIATDIANRPFAERAVFAPPVCLFGEMTVVRKNGTSFRSAQAANVVAAPVIVVELDERPTAGLAVLNAVLGEPTIVVASGGVWAAADGSIEPKLHAYWRLSTPATTPEHMAALVRARAAAAKLAGGDETAISLSHPMRWPGSWHTKNEKAVLCRIVGGDPKRDVVLAWAAEKLDEALDLVGLEVDGRSAVAGIRTGFKTTQPWDENALNDAARLIPNEGLAWDKWNTIGMAFYDASHASDEGLEAFHAWSQKDPRYDPEDAENRWSHWGSYPPGNLSAGTLRHEIRKVEPGFNPRYVAAEKHWEEPDPSVAAPSDQAGCAVLELNATEAVVMIGSKTLILTEEAGRLGSVSFSRVQDRRTWYANQKVLVEKRPQPVFDLWLEHPQRRQFSKVVFEPGGAPPGSFNLWRGFAVEPDASASCRLFLDHVRENVCCGDADNFRWLMGWLAHMVQRPSEKPGVAVVLRGGRGVGKTLVGSYVGALFPDHHVTIAQAKQLTGNFNAHLQHALLIQVEEALWAGDKQAEGALKNLVTSETRMVEPKGVDPFQVRDCARILMTSNNDWVVPAGNDERRWAVFDVGDARKQDKAYFAAMGAELKAGGAGALLHHLQSLDPSTTDVRTAPKTSGLLAQQLASLPSLPHWLFDCLRDGSIDASGVWPGQIGVKLLYGSYQRAIEKDRFARLVTQEQFGRTLNELLAPGTGLQKIRPRQEAGPRPSYYMLPSLDECRASFEKWIGHVVPWDA